MGAAWLFFCHDDCDRNTLPRVSPMKGVLLTGGAGFIGSHVAEQLLAAGESVTIVDDLSTGRRAQVPEGAEFLQLDIRAPAVRSLVASGRFSRLVNLAAQADVRVSVERPSFDADVNIGGLLNLLGGVRAGGVERVVHASSGGVVYGATSLLPTPEEASLWPTSPYGVSKLAGEHYLRVCGTLEGFGTMALRFANVYGPRQDPNGEAGVVAIFMGRILAGQPLTVFGDGYQTRDFVHVADVARAVCLALSLPAGEPEGGPINIGTGIETSVLDLVKALQAATGRQAHLRFEAERPGELRRNALLVDRAAARLGWAPHWSLTDGLRDLATRFHDLGS